MAGSVGASHHCGMCHVYFWRMPLPCWHWALLCTHSIWRMAGKGHCVPKAFTDSTCLALSLPFTPLKLAPQGAAASSARNLSSPRPETAKQARVSPCWESLWLDSLIARTKLNRLRHKGRIVFCPSLHTWVAEWQNQEEIWILHPKQLFDTSRAP